MYSAVFFGWPVTTISPKRETSTPTWSIEVASTTSTGARPLAAARARPLGQRVRRPAVRSRESLASSAAFAVVGDRLPACRGVELRVEADLQPLERRADVGRGDARGELLRWSSMPDAGAIRSDRPLRRPWRADPGGDVVVEVAAHAGELPGGVEVADERHVRVGRRAVAVEQRLPGQQQDLARAGSRPASAAPRARRRPR